MLTLFLARKKMAIWENGAFSAVREGEIQFQNMVRSMIFSSCQFFEFLYFIFVIKFFDARVKVQPISVSYEFEGQSKNVKFPQKNYIKITILHLF